MDCGILTGAFAAGLQRALATAWLETESLLLRFDKLRDGWPSGLRRTPGKRVGMQVSRGFKSHPVRTSRRVDR